MGCYIKWKNHYSPLTSCVFAHILTNNGSVLVVIKDLLMLFGYTTTRPLLKSFPSFIALIYLTLYGPCKEQYHMTSLSGWWHICTYYTTNIHSSTFAPCFDKCCYQRAFKKNGFMGICKGFFLCASMNFVMLFVAVCMITN